MLRRKNPLQGEEGVAADPDATTSGVLASSSSSADATASSSGDGIAGGGVAGCRRESAADEMAAARSFTVKELTEGGGGGEKGDFALPRADDRDIDLDHPSLLAVGGGGAPLAGAAVAATPETMGADPPRSSFHRRRPPCERSASPVLPPGFPRTGPLVDSRARSVWSREQRPYHPCKAPTGESSSLSKLPGPFLPRGDGDALLPSPAIAAAVADRRAAPALSSSSSSAPLAASEDAMAVVDETSSGPPVPAWPAESSALAASACALFLSAFGLGKDGGEAIERDSSDDLEEDTQEEDDLDDHADDTDGEDTTVPFPSGLTGVVRYLSAVLQEEGGMGGDCAAERRRGKVRGGVKGAGDRGYVVAGEQESSEETTGDIDTAPSAAPREQTACMRDRSLSRSLPHPLLLPLSPSFSRCDRRRVRAASVRLLAAGTTAAGVLAAGTADATTAAVPVGERVAAAVVVAAAAAAAPEIIIGLLLESVIRLLLESVIGLLWRSRFRRAASTAPEENREIAACGWASVVVRCCDDGGDGAGVDDGASMAETPDRDGAAARGAGTGTDFSEEENTARRSLNVSCCCCCCRGVVPLLSSSSAKFVSILVAVRLAGALPLRRPGPIPRPESLPVPGPLPLSPPGPLSAAALPQGGTAVLSSVLSASLPPPPASPAMKPPSSRLGLLHLPPRLIPRTTLVLDTSRTSVAATGTEARETPPEVGDVFATSSTGLEVPREEGELADSSGSGESPAKNAEDLCAAAAVPPPRSGDPREEEPAGDSGSGEFSLNAEAFCAAAAVPPSRSGDPREDGIADDSGPGRSPTDAEDSSAAAAVAPLRSGDTSAAPLPPTRDFVISSIHFAVPPEE